jgi:hypothetical protein
MKNNDKPDPKSVVTCTMGYNGVRQAEIAAGMVIDDLAEAGFHIERDEERQSEK